MKPTRCRTGVAIGQAAGAAGAAALSALTGAPGLLLLAAIAILAGGSQVPAEQVTRIARRVTQPEWWPLTRQVAAATSLLNTYPRIADLWGVPTQRQSEFAEQFERLTRLQ